MFATTAFRFASILFTAVVDTQSLRQNNFSQSSKNLVDIWGGIVLVFVGSVLSLSPSQNASSTQTSCEKKEENVIIGEAFPERPNIDAPVSFRANVISPKARSLSWSPVDHDDKPERRKRSTSSSTSSSAFPAIAIDVSLVPKGFSRIMSSDLLDSWGGEAPSVGDLRRSWSSKSFSMKKS